jgi:hypothetical protein
MGLKGLLVQSNPYLPPLARMGFYRSNLNLVGGSEGESEAKLDGDVINQCVVGVGTSLLSLKGRC